jgi:hypothetical protein
MSDTFTFLQYPQRSILIYADGHSRTQNMPFNTTRKTIYKGVDSTLGFEVKNQDRKPINLLNRDILVNIMQVRTGELVVQRRATAIKPEEGFCEFTVFSSDIIDLDPGLYQLSAVVYEPDGMAKALYADNNRRATMELEIVEGAYPKFIPSVELSFSQLGSSWVSQPVASNLQKNDSSTLHTIQIAVTNFTGTVEALVSLEYDSMGNYFPVRFVNDKFKVEFTNDTDVQGWNFIADARWVKILYTPDSSNTGTVDKILYRS